MNSIRPLLAIPFLAAGIAAAAPTVDISATEAQIKGDPIVVNIQGKAPFSVREVGASAKGGLLKIERRTPALPGMKSARFTLAPVKTGTATVSVSDADGAVDYVITVSAGVREKPKPQEGTRLKASLSADRVIVGGDPVTLAITDGKPPYKVTEASRDNLLRIDDGRPSPLHKKPADPRDSFTIHGLRAGNAILAISDADGTVKLSLGVVAPKPDPVKKPPATPLEASLSATSIAEDGEPATVRIAGGLPPYKVEDAGNTGNVRIVLPGGPNPLAKDRPLDGHAIHGLRPGDAVIAVRDQSGQLVKLRIGITPRRK